MWAVGALLLVSLIDQNRQADRARQRQLVVSTMREAAVEAPWIAFNGAGSSRAQVDRRLAGLNALLRSSVIRLRALGDTRSSAQIGASIAGALELVGHRRGALARGAAEPGDRDRRPLDPSRGRRLPPLGQPGECEHRVPAAGRRRGPARRIVSVVLALVVLLAFSLALRPLDARPPPRRGALGRQAGVARAEPGGRDDGRADGHAEPPQAVRRRRAAAARAARRRQPSSLGIFDLDGFKTYNDTFGHPAGDSLLAHLGHQLADGDARRGRRLPHGRRRVLRRHRARRTRSDVLADAATALTEHGERFSITLLVRQRRDPRRGARPRAGAPARRRAAVRQQGADPVDRRACRSRMR